ncbi:hypothetical protein [Pseudonocardia endophytica]|uniref:Uncharacterized protein n=1 Tax=Pseudonocardia endophytica TaxID=401976 RepID=A0A4R1HP73_PSEEN|nr:hypothetical protein [Pseudonocardia endophytica]TCK22933.1 hypothetical protein EV378_6944 [Pseudonocardia endophytica]
MDADGTVDEATDELYRVAPEDFVAERDARVAVAKENGDKDAARALGALRRPSRAAWLVNLLVHDRRDEVEGLLGLAETLASAQRTLDGAALRQMTAQRNKLVGALSRQATALGREAGHRVDSGLERDVRGILESALADSELADRIRSGRLVKAERHAGFGPEPEAGAAPRPAGRAPSGNGDAGADRGETGDDDTGDDTEDAGEQRRREKQIAEAEAALQRAEQAATEARGTHDRTREQAEEATRRQEESRDRVTELIEELDRARDEYAAANKAAHSGASAEKEAARTARAKDTARDRAAAALDELRSS